MERESIEERKQKIYGLICDERYVPMKAKEIAILLDIPKERRPELEEALEALVLEGKVEVSKKGKYSRMEDHYLTGVFECNARGFGFLRVEDGDDIFIPESETNGAMHLDTVKVKLMPSSRGKRPEGSVVKVLQRGITRIVGRYAQNKTFGFVAPDDQRIQDDIYIPQEHSLGAKTGQKVVCELADLGHKGRKPEGRIVEILGFCEDPGVDILSIIKAYDLPMEFPDKVLSQAGRAGQQVAPEDREGRLDAREWQTVTIDGEDAKDLDDAITLTKEDGVYTLGVHIADVTHYVKEGSALDEEAKKRGTSVYLTDRVIPMLPPALSNGICSLNQGEDRLALSCIMKIDEKGKIFDHEIAETVIRVDRRMSYTSVKKILQDRDPQEMEKYRELIPMFERMGELADLLRKKRMARGSIDFDFPETKITLDENGKPIDVRPYERNVATKIIEDFMLAANETVAEDYFWQELPFLYRTHENPDEEKIQKLAIFINNYGFSMHIGRDEVHPKELQKLLQKIEGTPQEAMISRLTLRSMKQAKYTVDCTGHFGLAAKYYCHFTSPIRRYPDLQIHRIIKENLHGRLNDARKSHYDRILPEVADLSSRRERIAEEAERETDKLKKVEYMSGHIGEVFPGVISGITRFGMYVELENTIEGMVRLTDLTDDFYEYVEEKNELVGEITNRHFKLGQRVDVLVTDADRFMRTIDFVLAGGKYGGRRKKTGSK